MGPWWMAAFTPATDSPELDGNLTRQALSSPVNRNIIRCVNRLDHSHRAKVVAEYVETTEQKSLLEELGCDVFQGWLTARPCRPIRSRPILTAAKDIAMQPSTDQRRHSPAAERNGPFILTELQRLLPATGTLLEIASGTGQHAAFCAAGLPGWQWQPSDYEAAALTCIAAWCAGNGRVLPPIELDVLTPDWFDMTRQFDAIYCANMIHISPWACTLALLRGAARHLTPQGVLITYGPYLVDGLDTAPSNLAFDADLRTRNPAWGLRRLSDIAAQATAVGLHLRERSNLPANNLLLVWERT